MINTNKKGFTLVELIVVITILAILGTIGFISLQGYSSEARDSKRVTDLGQIRTGIQVYQAKNGVVPEPNDSITVGSGSTIYTIQGYAGTGTLRKIKVNDDAKDPLEENYYTYTTNGSKTKFQLLALLENNNTAYNVIPTIYANYETRESYSIGDQLGTLLEPTTNIPLQEIGNDIDLSVDTTEYSAVFNKNDIQILAGETLYNEIVARSNGIGVIDKTEEELYSFISHTFTNCGQTGRFGPTLNQCTSSYDTTWDEDTNYFNMNTQGIQEWTVPKSGTYRITAYGAKGGDNNYYGNWRYLGGLGAVIEGSINLIKGQKLNIVVGHKGLNGYGNQNTGGGGAGGTFVFTGNVSGNGLIIAAGGGAGSHEDNKTDGNNYRYGQTSTYSWNGNSSYNSTILSYSAAGGKNGNPGLEYGTCNYCGGAGVGWLGFANSNERHGKLFNGGNNSSQSCNQWGGFGGGGSSYDSNRCEGLLPWSHGVGAGGGYSGGGGSEYRGLSGGGSSFISLNVINPSTSDGNWLTTGNESQPVYEGTVGNLNKWNNGHGKVFIKYIGN